MKKILIIPILLFFLINSTNSYAEWTKMVDDGTKTFYLDFNRIRKVDGYFYYWILIDIYDPKKEFLSVKNLHQGDCKLFRWKALQSTTYNQQMGGGNVINTQDFQGTDLYWYYPLPDSSGEYLLNKVCNMEK